jgi:hypothetical protein
VQIIEIGDSSHVEEHSAQIVLARYHVDELRVQRHLDGSQLYEDGVVCYFRQVRRQGFGLDPLQQTKKSQEIVRWRQRLRHERMMVIEYKLRMYSVESCSKLSFMAPSKVNNDLSGNLELLKSEVKPVHHVNIVNCQIVDCHVTPRLNHGDLGLSTTLCVKLNANDH